MKIKYLFSVVLSLLIMFSISQMFIIPPYAGDVYSLYKSGYFRELDRGFMVIKDSFIGIKTLGEPVYGWIFLQDIEKSQGITVKVYDRRGRLVAAPGDVRDEINEEVLKVMALPVQGIQASPAGGNYRAIIPLRCEDKCGFCHNECRSGRIIGAMAFQRDYDAQVYYSSERVIIFLGLTVLLCLLLFFVLRWDPARSVKELFDK